MYQRLYHRTKEGTFLYWLLVFVVFSFRSFSHSYLHFFFCFDVSFVSSGDYKIIYYLKLDSFKLKRRTKYTNKYLWNWIYERIIIRFGVRIVRFVDFFLSIFKSYLGIDRCLNEISNCATGASAYWLTIINHLFPLASFSGLKIYTRIFVDIQCNVRCV